MENTLLNLIPSSYIPEVHLSQYDIGRELTFKLMDGNTEYSVPSGAVVTVKATKPSGLGFVVNAEADGNIVTIVNTETMTNESGRFSAELSISSGATLLGTSNFIFNIEKSPHPEGTTDGDVETLIPELTLLVNEARSLVEQAEETAQTVTGLEPRVSTAETNISSINTELSVLDARMDTFASLPDGSTSGDAELMDIRVGSDGITYANAGNAVRTQIINLENKIVTKVALTSNDVFNGFVVCTDGTFYDHANYRRTGYVPLIGAIWGKYVYVNCSFVGDSGVSFYDKGKNFIKGYTYDTRPEGGKWGLNKNLAVEIPQNAYYIATSIAAADYSDPSDLLIAFASTHNSNDQINMENKIDDLYDINEKVVNGNSINILNNQIWTLGGLNGSGEEITAAKRLRSGYIDTSAFSIIKIGVDANYFLALHFYDSNKTHVYDTGWLSAASLINIPDGSKYVRVLIRNDTAVVLNDYEHISVLGFYEYAKGIDILEGVVWELGTISGGGSDAETSYRIRTKTYIPVKTIKSLDIKIVGGYEFGYTFYTSNKTMITNKAYFGNYLHLEVPENAYFVRFIIRNLYSNAATITWAENVSCIGNPVLMDKINKLLSDANGQGDYQYTGSKIILKDRIDQINKCQITVWKDFKNSEISNITDYKLHLNQSIAMYGGYLFLLEETGLGVVIDYATKNIVSTFALPVPNDNHYNSAMFTDIFYDDNDEFPLMITSRCGNLYDKTTDLNEAMLLRVQRNGTTFTCTLINSIKSDIQGFSSDWCVDNNNRSITFIVYTNGTFLENENNPVKFFTWNLPKVSEILSGETITLLEDDLIAKAECEHLIFQGATIIHNIIYIGMQPTSGGRYIYGIDVKKGAITSIVPLISDREIEGVAVHNGKMYVSQKDGEDTTGTNPLTIYELLF